MTLSAIIKKNDHSPRKGYKFSEDDKVKFVKAFLDNGKNMAATHKYLTEEKGYDIAVATLRRYRLETAWWGRLEAALNIEELEQHIANLENIKKSAWESVQDRLQNGDEVVTKNGLERKKVNAKDLAAIAGEAQKQAALLQGDPTSITETRTTDQKLKDLSKHFQELGKKSVTIDNNTQTIIEED